MSVNNGTNSFIWGPSSLTGLITTVGDILELDIYSDTRGGQAGLIFDNVKLEGVAVTPIVVHT